MCIPVKKEQTLGGAEEASEPNADKSKTGQTGFGWKHTRNKQKLQNLGDCS